MASSARCIHCGMRIDLNRIFDWSLQSCLSGEYVYAVIPNEDDSTCELTLAEDECGIYWVKDFESRPQAVIDSNAWVRAMYHRNFPTWMEDQVRRFLREDFELLLPCGEMSQLN